MTDEALLRLVREGHEEVFVDLYGRYRDPLFRFAYRMTSSVDAAEDLMPGGVLRTFLYGTVRNLALKRLRTTNREELADGSGVAGTGLRSRNSQRFE